MKNKLQRAADEYTKQIEEYALKQFNKIVGPYCAKHGYDFTTGNGTWLISYDDPESVIGFRSVYSDKIPAYVLKALDTEIPHNDNLRLSDYMPDYTHVSEHDFDERS